MRATRRPLWPRPTALRLTVAVFDGPAENETTMHLRTALPFILAGCLTVQAAPLLLAKP